MAGRLIACFYLTSVAVAEWMVHRAFLLTGLYLLTSLWALTAYAADKRAAMKGRWRIPESNLHLLALAGGWPGAMFAQQLFRHKTVKRSFRAVFWITAWLNTAVTAGLLISVQGQAALERASQLL